MLYLLRFTHVGKDYFLHTGDNSFVGGDTKKQAEDVSYSHVYTCLPVGGTTILPITKEELAKSVGVPYKIITFTGGFGRNIYGVPIQPTK